MFLYFDIKNNPKGEIRKVRANEYINTVNYWIDQVREVKPNVYLVSYQKRASDYASKNPPQKHFIVDASKNELSASISQISLPFD